MTLPFLWLSLGTAAGILCSKVWSFPSLYVWVAFGISVSLLWFARGRKIFLLFLIFASAILGYLYASAQNARPSNAIENFAGGPESGDAFVHQHWIALKGLVDSQPEIKKKGRKVSVSLVLSTESMRNYGKGKSVSGKVQVFMVQPQTIPDTGDRVELKGVLTKPSPKLNPGSFDYAYYLSQSGIYCILTGYGKNCIRIQAKNQGPFLMQWISNLRTNIAAVLDSHFPPEEAALFKALILGLRKGISRDRCSEYLKTGTSHLLAISGLNVSLVAGSAYLLMIVFGLGQKLAALTALIIVLIFVGTAGAGIPVQRAGWMSSAGFAAILLERERNSLNIFFLSFFVLILTDTKNFETVSFQLSFLSVLALILTGGLIGRRWQWAECLTTSASVLMLTFPLVLFYFNVFSPIGIVANLLAIPLFDFVMLTIFCYLAFFYVPVLGHFLGAAALFFLKAANLWIHYVSLFPWGYYFLRPPSLLHLLLYYLLCSLILIPRFFKLSIPKVLYSFIIFGWAVAAILFFIPKPKPAFEFILFSAGKNEMAFWQMDGYSWLINTGRKFPSDQAEWILMSFLKWKGIRKLDGVFLTDSYKKHTGGLQTLRRDFLIKSLWIPEKNKLSYLPKTKVIKISSEGDYAIPDKVYAWTNSRGQMSIEFLMSAHPVLFLSDLDSEIIGHLRNHKYLLPAEFLVLASKDFRFSDLEQLLDLTGAQKVILPYANPILKKFLEERGAHTWATFNEGALTLRLKDLKSEMKIDRDVI